MARVAGFVLPVLLACTAATLMPAASAQTAHYEATFRLGGEVQYPQTYSLSLLKELPATKLDVTYLTGAGPVSAAYTGVLLWDLLTTAGVVTNPAVKNDILRKEVVVTGSDGYQTVFSMGELDPFFGGASVIVAYLQNGQPLGSSSGAAQIVVPGDKAGGRFVFTVAAIRVTSVK